MIENQFNLFIFFIQTHSSCRENLSSKLWRIFSYFPDLSSSLAVHCIFKIRGITSQNNESCDFLLAQFQITNLFLCKKSIRFPHPILLTFVSIIQFCQQQHPVQCCQYLKFVLEFLSNLVKQMTSPIILPQTIHPENFIL